MPNIADLQWLFKRIDLRMPLTEAQKNALAQAVQRTQQFPKNADLVQDGERVHQSLLLLTGFTTRYRVVEEGKRQITSIHVPGDFVDLHSFPLQVMDHAVGALTDCTVAIFPHAALLEITRTDPYLTRALWMLTLLDAAIHREWIVALGAKDAVSRMAHVVCELFARLSSVGLTAGRQFLLPMTQLELSEALGLSAVHVNRVLQELRRKKLIEFDGRTMTILDWYGLVDVAEFDGNFLHRSLERDVDVVKELA